MLNVNAKVNHIIPPNTTQARTTEVGPNGGHVWVFVSGKSQGRLGNGAVD